MALSDLVNISISLSADKVSRPGFGAPMVLAVDAGSGFTEYVRYYTDMTGVLADFAVTTATYKMCNRIFSQNPRPPRLAVGRLAHKPTLALELTPIASNSTAFVVTVNGTAVTFTSDGSGTVAEATAGLKTLIDALSVSGLTTTDGGTKLTVTTSAAGGWFSLAVANTALIKVVDVTPDVSSGNLASDLAAIYAEDPSGWYALMHPFQSKAIQVILDTWAEANGKLLLLGTQDSDTINVAVGSDTSTTAAGTLKASTALRASVWYHPDNGSFIAGALAGACLPLDPGSETWAFKTLAGVASTTLTATQRTNALAKYANVYETISGVSVTEMGKVSGNEYIDVIRFRDWLQVNMSADIFAALTRSKKIPFTDDGITMIQGIVLARLKLGVASGGLSSSPAPTCTVPKAADVSSSDKSSRTLNNVKFDATLAGAIHVVTVTGVISA